jgi:hypothetical protein
MNARGSRDGAMIMPPEDIDKEAPMQLYHGRYWLRSHQIVVKQLNSWQCCLINSIGQTNQNILLGIACFR